MEILRAIGEKLWLLRLKKVLILVSIYIKMSYFWRT